MPKVSLNPTKGVVLKTYAKVRKMIKGKRKTVKVDFTDIPEKKWRTIQWGGGPGTVALPSTYTAYDILSLANMKGSQFYEGEWKGLGYMQLPQTRQEALNLLNVRFNLYNKYYGWKVPVTYLYSEKSRVVRGTANLVAVRLKDGSKGWLTREGKFIGQDTMRELLYDVDLTLPAATSDISLLDAWDAMSAQQKADFVDAMQDFDWDAFWEEIGSDDPARDLSAATNAYYDLIETIGDILGW